MKVHHPVNRRTCAEMMLNLRTLSEMLGSMFGSDTESIAVRDSLQGQLTICQEQLKMVDDDAATGSTTVLTLMRWKVVNLLWKDVQETLEAMRVEG